jgi:hypothetical protein
MARYRKTARRGAKAGIVTVNPVTDIARALEGDGFSPVVNFALMAPDGAMLYCGPVNSAMAALQRQEQALRASISRGQTVVRE